MIVYDKITFFIKLVFQFCVLLGGAKLQKKWERMATICLKRKKRLDGNNNNLPQTQRRREKIANIGQTRKTIGKNNKHLYYVPSTASQICAATPPNTVSARAHT